MPESLSVYYLQKVTRRFRAVFDILADEFQVAVVLVVHVVHDGATSVVHVFLEFVSVHLVVVGVWFAQRAGDEGLVLVLEAVGADNDHVDSVEGVLNDLKRIIRPSYPCFYRELRRFKIVE